MDDVSRPARSFFTAIAFCAPFSKNYDRLPFPNFSETGREWASKAKAHIRLQVKAVLLAKEFDLTNSDLRRWTEIDIRVVQTFSVRCYQFQAV